MPQLDKISYISQVLWVLLLSINFYILLILVLFINFINIKKIQISRFAVVKTLFSTFKYTHDLIDFYKKTIL